MKNLPLENVTTQQRNNATISLIAITISTEVGFVAIKGIDVQSKLRRWRTIARKRKLGCRRSRIRYLNRMLGIFVQSHFIVLLNIILYCFILFYTILPTLSTCTPTTTNGRHNSAVTLMNT